MKTIKVFIFSLLFLLFSQLSFAQTQKEARFAVSGECGMCKKKIETAAKEAGASFADWNTETKQLVVKFDQAKSNAARIQQAIAAVGYDTPGYKATDDAYNKLHGCCKYDRTAAATSCCTAEKCTGSADCCSNGKCTAEAGCCTKEDKSCCTAAAGKTCCVKS
ncbi:MAG TPA: cation transporter [Chitinophagaceae bacterium]|nr:cation transporter [Chitinophagaceae bacterium]